MPKTIADKLAKSLAIEVEELQQEGALQIKNSVIPLNLKVKVRPKDNGNTIVRRGMITIPKNKECNDIPERIHLACSDQTIISFNILLDADFEKKKQQPKTKKNIFGLCLGIESEAEDSHYIPSDPEKKDSSKSDTNIVKNKVPVKHVKNVQRASTVVKKHNSFFGKCKPGGCLDPPFGEEKYAYKRTLTPTNILESKINHLSSLEKITVPINEPSHKKNEQDQSCSILCKKTSLEQLTEEIPIQKLYQGITKTMLENNASDSIITYPTSLSSSSSIEKEKNEKNMRTSRTKQSIFNECNRQYFIPPKTSIASNIEPVIENFAKYSTLNNKRNTSLEDEPTLNLELTTSKDKLSKRETFLENQQCLNNEIMTKEPSRIPQNLLAENVSQMYPICDTVLNRNADSTNGCSSNITVKLSTPKPLGSNAYPNNEPTNERQREEKLKEQFYEKVITPRYSSQKFCTYSQTEQNKHNLRDEEPQLESHQQSRNEVIKLATLIIDVICQQHLSETTIRTKLKSKSNVVEMNSNSENQKVLQGEGKIYKLEFPITNIKSTQVPSNQQLPEASMPNALMIPITVPIPVCQRISEHGLIEEVTDQIIEKEITTADLKSKSLQFDYNESNELNYRKNKPGTLLNKLSHKQLNQAKEKTASSRQIASQLSRQGSIQSYNKKDNIDNKYINSQFSCQESMNKIPSLHKSHHGFLQNEDKLESSKENSENSLFKRLSRRLSNKSKDKHSRKTLLHHRTSLIQPISNSIIKTPSQECHKWDLMSKESTIMKNSISKELDNQDDLQTADNIIARKTESYSVDVENRLLDENFQISKESENKKLNNGTDLSYESSNKKTESVIGYTDLGNNYGSQLSSYTSKQNDIRNISISEFDKQIEYEISFLPEMKDDGHISQDISFAITISDITNDNLISETNSQTFELNTDKNNISNTIINHKIDRFIDQDDGDDDMQNIAENIIIRDEHRILSDSYHFTDPEHDSSRVEIASTNKHTEKKLSSDVISFDIKNHKSNSEILTFSIEYGDVLEENVHLKSPSSSDNDKPAQILSKLFDYTTIPITQPNEYKFETETLPELKDKFLHLVCGRDTESENSDEKSSENSSKLRVTLTTSTIKIMDTAEAKNFSTAQVPSRSLENISTLRVPSTAPTSKIANTAESRKLSIALVMNHNKPIDNNTDSEVTVFSNKRTITTKSTDGVPNIKPENMYKQKNNNFDKNTVSIENAKLGSISKSLFTPENRVERASIFVDLSFQANVEDSQIVIKSLDSRSDQRNKASFTSTITSEDEIKLPISENYTMSISINSSEKNKHNSYSRRPKYIKVSECKSDMGISSTGGIQISRAAVSNNIQTRMSFVCDKVLLPLHQAIQHLKEDLDELSTRQIALREAIRPRKLKINRTTHNFSNKACYCMRF